MNKLAHGIAVKLIEKNFLDINKKDEYIYVIETSLEKFLSYMFVLVIAVFDWKFNPINHIPSAFCQH